MAFAIPAVTHEKEVLATFSLCHKVKRFRIAIGNLFVLSDVLDGEAVVPTRVSAGWFHAGIRSARVIESAGQVIYTKLYAITFVVSFGVRVELHVELEARV